MEITRLPSRDLAFRVDPGFDGPQVVIIDLAGRGHWLTVADLAAINKAVAECEPYASWRCPHCGKNSPHQHFIDRKGFAHPCHSG